MQCKISRFPPGPHHVPLTCSNFTRTEKNHVDTIELENGLGTIRYDTMRYNTTQYK